MARKRKLGVCTAEELPAFLHRAAEALEIAWNFEQMHISSSVRGKKRQRIADWLSGA